MSEVASGILHNVGNILNSVHTSSSMIMNNASGLMIPSLEKLVALLKEQSGKLQDFFFRYCQWQRGARVFAGGDSNAKRPAIRHNP